MGLARVIRRMRKKAEESSAGKRRRKILFEPLEQRLLLDANPVHGSLDVPGESDSYTFSLTTDKRLLFDTLEGGTSIHCSLDGPRGQEVTNRAFSATGWSNNPTIDLVPGDYKLTVDGSGDATGPYAFRLLDLAAAPSLPLGTPVSAILDPGNSTRLYQFTAQAGDKVYFDSQDYTGNEYCTLIDPYAKPVFADSWSGYDVDVQTLAAPGTYTLVIEGLSYQTTPGSIRFALQPVHDDTAPLAVGARVDGAIAHAGQQDLYTFSLTTPADLCFDALSEDGAGLTWTLKGPRGIEENGNLWASSYKTLPFHLVPGDYTLTVDGSQDATGEYGFRLLDVAAVAATLPLDTPVSGTLDPGNEVDLYRFSAAAGDQLFFDSQGLTGGTSTYWSLADPYGRPVFENNYAGYDAGLRTLPVSGTYTLILDGHNPADTLSTYAFTVERRGNTPPPPVTGASVGLGTVVQGTLAVAGEVDPYVFTLATPTRLVFDALTNDYALTWSLRGPRGIEASNQSFRYYDNTVLDLVAGEYGLTIQSTGAAPTPYGFRLLDLATATPVSPGTAVTGTLTPANATAAYRLTAAAGDQVYFDAQTSRAARSTGRCSIPTGPSCSARAGPT